jgi:CubicO group peptidase (beta-lactamase class C family)
MASELSEFLPELEELLDTGRREAHIPGVAMAVGLGDETIELASGLLNVDTGVETTTDSLFQVGSITKLYTATLVMQLVDEGLIDLDTPVRTYVPEFSIADEVAGQTVTVRQLLCHTGGFEGDVFDDFGRGEEAIARYVEALKERHQICAPGRLFSYCNSGYSVLGRLIERVRDVPSWHVALREHLIGPLGLRRTVSLPEEAIMFRTAAGHVNDASKGAGAQRVAPLWHLTAANAPAGSMLCSSAGDVVAFVRMHLRGGITADGTRVLSERSVTAMREAQIRLPSSDDVSPNGWGLGWMLFDFPNGRYLGHDGSTIGQTAMMRCVPEHELSFAVLTNGGRPARLMHEVRRRTLARFAGIEVSPLPTPPRPRIEIERRRFVGRYETACAYYDVTQDAEGGLQVEVGRRGALAERFPDSVPELRPLVGYDETSLISAEPDGGTYRRFTFADPGPDGRTPYLCAGLRVALRVDDGEGAGTGLESRTLSGIRGLAGVTDAAPYPASSARKSAS